MYVTMVGHKSLSGADVRSGEIIVAKRVWHPWGTLTSASLGSAQGAHRATSSGRIGSLVSPQGWAIDDLTHFTRERRVRDLGPSGCRRVGGRKVGG